MERLADEIKNLIESEGYVVPPFDRQQRTTKKGLAYNSIKITVKQNEFSVPLPAKVAKVEDLTLFEYKKSTDFNLNSEDLQEINAIIKGNLISTLKQLDKHYKDPNSTREIPTVARLFTYISIEDDVINDLLTSFIKGQKKYESVDIEWSPHVMRDKFDKPLKVFLVRFKRRATTTI